ncbi:cyanophycinase [Rhizobium leguminosarum]|uniref:Cyanophycinase n=2 Tax=Rhizobium/Agrobacterium group TaxID=227290 RepID=C6B854_RHILS|nr:cyanophycinase [Rhizobium leguminosarum]ACS60586.1 cyanophycinase [Rhizobium leguminosarum bv. trifolii WSM1325]MBY2910148.1 cyanophycinase [Rhizobium leguminosarum]MBY2917723.1 cyanophycinase [Rhizobium leguminosarum]MBY2925374.1 cyanophycinase [Rhizobium leguminosarum]MBY2936294.1 cyanophycinase [Rhizobium leguminosarum]
MLKKTKTANGRDGTLIIIGGHEDHDGERVILKEVAKNVRDGKLVLATVASHEPEGYLEKYQRSFGDLGIPHVTELYIEERDQATSEDKLAGLRDVGAVFFSGGDQLRITSLIGDTPIDEHVHEIFANGGVIAGTSAGASAMSDTMLVRGSNASSFRIGDLSMAPGLGLLPNVIIDQHFAERGRIGRLIGAVSQNPRVLGIGIDEDTAIVVRGHRFEVIGTGAVYLVDAGDITHTNIAEASPDEALSIYDLKLHVLSSGDGFNLETRRPDRETVAVSLEKRW